MTNQTAEPDWRRIEGEIAGLAVRAVSFLGEGWTSRLYVVNENQTFKFPKHVAHWASIERAAAFLDRMGALLPLAVPKFEHLAPASPAASCGYAVCRYLPGVVFDLHRLSPKGQTAAAERIAAFLRALHDLRLPDEVMSNLPWRNERTIAQDCLAAARTAILPELSPTQARILTDRFEAFLESAENFTSSPTVIHGDFQIAHIIVRDGQVTGVVDFGGIAWGDPDFDFKDLYQDYGADFAVEVAKRYGHPDIERLIVKLDYLNLWNIVDMKVNSPAWAPAGTQQRADDWLRCYFAAHPGSG